MAKGQRGAAIDAPAQRAHTIRSRSGFDGRFERALASGCAEECDEACSQCTRGASRCSTAPLGRQLTGTMAEHRSLPLRPLGQVGMARVDRAARVAKGQRGAVIDVLRTGGSPFSADHPRLGCCNNFKDATEAASAPPPHSCECPHVTSMLPYGDFLVRDQIQTYYRPPSACHA